MKMETVIGGGKRQREKESEIIEKVARIEELASIPDV